MESAIQGEKCELVMGVVVVVVGVVLVFVLLVVEEVLAVVKDLVVVKKVCHGTQTFVMSLVDWEVV